MKDQIIFCVITILSSHAVSKNMAALAGQNVAVLALGSGPTGHFSEKQNFLGTFISAHSVLPVLR